jgi:hypothetical protein
VIEATMRRRVLALAAAVALVAGCSSGDDDPSTVAGSLTTGTTTTTTAPSPTQTRQTTHTSTTSTQTEPRVTTETEPGVAPSPPAPRTAPPSRAGVLRFDRVVVLEGSDGKFAGHANMTNEGAAYLNGLQIAWRILGPNGVELDRSVSRWPNLAPGETATIELDGSRVYSDAWVRVRFVVP